MFRKSRRGVTLPEDRPPNDCLLGSDCPPPPPPLLLRFASDQAESSAGRPAPAPTSGCVTVPFPDAFWAAAFGAAPVAVAAPFDRMVSLPPCAASGLESLQPMSSRPNAGGFALQNLVIRQFKNLDPIQPTTQSPRIYRMCSSFPGALQPWQLSLSARLRLANPITETLIR